MKDEEEPLSEKWSEWRDSKSNPSLIFNDNFRFL